MCEKPHQRSEFNSTHIAYSTQTNKGNKMASKNNIVISALADLWCRDILGLIESGKHKDAISIGVKMGLKKKYLLDIIKEWT